MFTRKTLFWVLAILGLIALDGLLSYKLAHWNQKSKPELGSFEPQVPQTPPMLLMNEQSGEVSRVITKDPKDNDRIKSIDVGYQDGRTGQYSFEKGKLRFYKGSDKNGKLFFEAEYEPNGLLASYRYLRVDGSVETSFRHLPDGTDEVVFYNKDGYVTATHITASDGSQTRSSRPDPLKQPTLSSTKAEPSESKFRPFNLEDGSQSWQLKVKLNGTRISQWEYFNLKGVLTHTGKINANSDVEITVIRPDGTKGFKQLWTCIGEDWARRYYRLSSIEGYNPDGSIAVEIAFHADGKTPKEISKFSTYPNYGGGYPGSSSGSSGYPGYAEYYGGGYPGAYPAGPHKSSTEFFNPEGFMYRQESYAPGGYQTGSYEIPKQYQQKAELPAALTEEIRDANSPVYRLKGTPYSTQAPKQGYKLNPLFVLPN